MSDYSTVGALIDAAFSGDPQAIGIVYGVVVATATGAVQARAWLKSRRPLRFLATADWETNRLYVRVLNSSTTEPNGVDSVVAHRPGFNDAVFEALEPTPATLAPMGVAKFVLADAAATLHRCDVVKVTALDGTTYDVPAGPLVRLFPNGHLDAIDRSSRRLMMRAWWRIRGQPGAPARRFRA